MTSSDAERMKRKRSQNFTCEETEKLLDLATPYLNILLSKDQSWRTNDDKNRVWLKIEKLFNSGGGIYRNRESLMHLWVNLKTQCRKLGTKKSNTENARTRNDNILERMLNIINTHVPIPTLGPSILDEESTENEANDFHNLVTNEEIIQTNQRSIVNSDDSADVSVDYYRIVTMDDSAGPEKKRRRKENFNVAESNKLLKLMVPRLSVLLNKKTDWHSNNEKMKAWMEVENAFNSEGGTYRDREALTKHWDNLKRTSKIPSHNCRCCFTRQLNNTSKQTCLLDQVRAMIALSAGCYSNDNNIDNSSNNNTTEEVREPTDAIENDENEVFIPQHMVCVEEIKDEPSEHANSEDESTEENQTNIPVWSTTPESTENKEPSKSLDRKETIEDLKKQLLLAEIEFKTKLYDLQLKAAENDLEIKTHILNRIKDGDFTLDTGNFVLTLSKKQK